MSPAANRCTRSIGDVQRNLAMGTVLAIRPLVAPRRQVKSDGRGSDFISQGTSKAKPT